jgi:hypothetical protein
MGPGVRRDDDMLLRPTHDVWQDEALNLSRSAVPDISVRAMSQRRSPRGELQGCNRGW